MISLRTETQPDFKKAIASILNYTIVSNVVYFKADKVEEWIKQLSTVYNRGFWHGGYYLEP